jgi:periplasmic divalent cation tolerance protein
VYRWRGAVEESDEALLVVKSTVAGIAAIERALGELHPYELPELVALAPAHVEARYLRWLAGSVAPASG